MTLAGSTLVALGSLSVGPLVPGPDLAASIVEAPARTRVGATFEVSGRIEAPLFFYLPQVAWRLSVQAASGSSRGFDVDGLRYPPYLEPFPIVVDVPETLPPGAYRVTLVVDPDDQISEREDNNTSANVPIEVLPRPMVFETVSLPDAVAGTAFEAEIEARGPIEKWRRIAGELPPGLQLFDSGRIAGVPAQEGLYPFTLALENEWEQVTGDFELRVVAAPAPVDPTPPAPEDPGPGPAPPADDDGPGELDPAQPGCRCVSAEPDPASTGAVLTAGGLLGLLLTRRRRSGRSKRA